MIGPTLALLLAAADPHSLGNPEAVRPTHIALDLTVDFDAKRLHGTAELDLAYAKGRPSTFLTLDSQGLEVARITDPESGQRLPFTFEPPVPFLGQRLRISLPERRLKQVRIEYRTGPQASALQWLDPAQTTSGQHPFLFTQAEAINARSFVPCIDSPGVRITYDAVIHVPPGMVAVMSAEHVLDDPAKGLFRFHMPESIPPYLIALAAGEISFRRVGPRTGVYAEPAVVDRAASEFADMEKMVSVAEALCGRYAWGRWDVIVLPPSFPFGGMENPRLTFATPTILAGDRSLVNVVVHELAHSWSGNLVTSATWSDMWLNEGFTDYLEVRLGETLYGRDFADREVLLAQRDIEEALADKSTLPDDTRLVPDLTGRSPDDGPPAAIPYSKGASFLRVLEARFGRPRLDAFLRGYFATNAFSPMTTDRFLELLKRDLFKGDEAAWKDARVEEWVHGRGLPDNVVLPASKSFELTRAAAARFAKDGSTEGVKADWSTAEWQDFLGALPRDVSADRMAVLDAQFHLSTVGNSEILFSWLRHVVWSAYEPGYPALEGFLTRQGRRKFLKPLYEDMEAKPETRALGRRIYAKARPGYHPLCVATIDTVLK
jgi:leukotriene-A4 hydrolase